MTKEDFRAKVYDAKQKARHMAEDALVFVDEHKEALVLCGGALTLLSGPIKRHERKKNIADQQRLKDLYVYDRREGHYCELRHKLTNTEWTRIRELTDRGLTTTQALDYLRLLK